MNQVNVPAKRLYAGYTHNRFSDACVSGEMPEAAGNRPQIIRAVSVRINGKLIFTYIDAILLS